MDSKAIGVKTMKHMKHPQKLKQLKQLKHTLPLRQRCPAAPQLFLQSTGVGILLSLDGSRIWQTWNREIVLINNHVSQPQNLSSDLGNNFNTLKFCRNPRRFLRKIFGFAQIHVACCQTWRHLRLGDLLLLDLSRNWVQKRDA